MRPTQVVAILALLSIQGSLGCNASKEDTRTAPLELALTPVQLAADWKCTWPEEGPNITSCDGIQSGPYTLSVDPRADSTLNYAYFRVHVLNEGKPFLEWQVARNTQVTLADSVAYLTHFEPWASGMDIGAFHLPSQLQLWAAEIEEIEVGHSRYSNEGAILAAYQDWLVVCGSEAAHSYVAVLDRHDGRTLAVNLRKPWTIAEDPRRSN